MVAFFIIFHYNKSGDYMKLKEIPSKILYLYFFIPIAIGCFINYSSNEDIWYILKYGEIILNKGFIHTDILSMHSNLHLVIQQGFTNVIFYFIYSNFHTYGIFLFLELFVILYLYFFYKISYLLTNNKLYSVITCIVSTIFLEFFLYPRAQLFTYLFILITIYILESFYKNNQTKLIYFLPLVSLLQINLHGALWISLFIFILPFLIQLFIEKNKNIIKLIVIIILMFLVGFLNPYTYELVFFPFLSYSSSLNSIISELFPITIFTHSGKIFYFLLATIIFFYIYNKNKKLEIRHLLLLYGTTFMTLLSIRNFAFFILGSIYPIMSYTKKSYIKVRSGGSVYLNLVYVFLILVCLFFSIEMNSIRLVSSVKKSGNYLLKHYSDSDITLYSEFDFGSYLEYIGYHPYIDTRAEVFLKKANHKEDIFLEFSDVLNGTIDFDKFIDKYQFTHFITYKNSYIERYLRKSSSFKKVFLDKNIIIYESILYQQ